jgi:hypothetical protein
MIGGVTLHGLTFVILGVRTRNEPAIPGAEVFRHHPVMLDNEVQP